MTIARLETRIMRPVYVLEIIKESFENPVDAEQKPATRVDCLALFQDDLVLCDLECNMYSLDKSK